MRSIPHSVATSMLDQIKDEVKMIEQFLQKTQEFYGTDNFDVEAIQKLQGRLTRWQETVDSTAFRAKEIELINEEKAS